MLQYKILVDSIIPFDLYIMSNIVSSYLLRKLIFKSSKNYTYCSSNTTRYASASQNVSKLFPKIQNFHATEVQMMEGNRQKIQILLYRICNARMFC